MRRLALFVSVLLCAAQIAGASLTLDIQGSVPLFVQDSVARALERSMLPRMAEGQVLVATVKDSHENAQFQLRLQLEGRELSFSIPQDIENLEGVLLSALAYDGLALLLENEALRLDFYAPTGFGFFIGEQDVLENSIYRVLDGKGAVHGRAVVSKISDDKTIGFLTQFEGKQLGLGMALEKEQSVQVGLSVSFDILVEPSFYVSYFKNLPAHPFYFSLGAGTLGYDALELSFLLGAKLPLSALFGSSQHLGRNISLGSFASLAVGYQFSNTQAYGRGKGGISVSYHMQNFSFSLSVGNQVALTNDTILARGFFISLLTAYMYSL